MEEASIIQQELSYDCYKAWAITMQSCVLEFEIAGKTVQITSL